MTATDQLAAIEARIHNCKTERTMSPNVTAALEDRAFLLAMVRERDAALERVRELHRGNRWGFCEACSEHVDIPMPCPTIAAITATEGA